MASSAMSAYSAMGNNRSDYEPHYGFTARQRYFGLHCHDFYELYVHFQGGRYFALDNEVYQMVPNQLIILPPFRMHGLVYEQELVDYERAYLYITPHTLRIAGCGQLDLEAILAAETSKGSYQFILDEKDAQTCKSLIKSMSLHLNDHTPSARFDDFVLMLPFLQIICRTLNLNNTAADPIVINEIMQAVLTYINGNFTQPLNLETLARHFGISVSYLSHEFVKYTNRSVYDYILYRRVTLAKEMIYTGVPLNDVAYQSGFNNYSNFLRMFKLLVGVSPNHYKKQVHGGIYLK